MAKTSYRIPTALNQKFGDTPISLKTKDNVGPRPIPIRTILLYLVSGLMCFLAVTKTIVASGTVFQKFLFVALWILISWVLFSVDGTGRMQFQLIPTLVNYLPKSSRYMVTRTDNNPSAFYCVVGIKDIGKNGLVTFCDGSFGYFYSVVGSASKLLFESDRDRILDRVDGFFRKISTECEVQFITTKSAQRVHKQKLAMRDRYKNLSDPELKALAQKEFDCLHRYVGGRYKSIHQYMLIKGDNYEVLENTKNVVRAEVESSTRMIRRCMPLKRAGVESLLAQIYRGKER